MTEPRDPFEQWLTGQHRQPLAPRPGDFDRIARAARRRRWARAAGTGAIVLVLLTSLAGAITALRVASDGAATAPTNTASGPNPTPHTSLSPAISTSPSLPATSRCQTSQLRLNVTPGDNASGHIGLNLVFTNISSQACTLDGYPAVTFVTGPTGAQINDPAQPSTALGSPTPIHLAAAGQAHAILLLVNVANYADPACKPTQTAGVRVYPPDDPAALYAGSTQQICSIAGIGLAQVYPIQAGG